MESACGLGEDWTQNVSVGSGRRNSRVASAEPRAKGDETTLNEQGPREGLLIGRRSGRAYRSRYQQPIVVHCCPPPPTPRSLQHRVERGRLDTCIAHAFTTVWGGTDTTGLKVSGEDGC